LAILSAGPSILSAMRPHQWAKNLLVAVPALAAHSFTAAAAGKVAAAFIAFCLVASATYIANDIVDRRHDRAHPRKSRRSIASGRLSPGLGLAAAACLVLSAAATIAFCRLPWSFAGVLAAYGAVTVAYSLALRRVAIIDVLALALLYGLRVGAGAAALEIGVSQWLIAFSLFFFLALALIKRGAELALPPDLAARAHAGRGYRLDALPSVLLIAALAGIVAIAILGFYLSTPIVRTLYSQSGFLWGACLIVAAWLARLVALTWRGAMHDDPVAFALTDWPSLMAGAAVVALYLLSL
jgi:4-hydroxybenzoate polyprenyltransferase